jgi:hypothetical protein
MLLASISIISPAISRLPGALAFFPISVLVPQLALLAALVVYDFVLKRRVHPATAWGETLYVSMTILSIVVGFSAAGRAFINALK